MEEHNWIKITLTPLSWIYGFVTGIRNFLFDFKILKSQKPPLFTISIGNLTVGGTGKTPVTEYLANLLKASHRIAILSRGYGRETKGFKVANDRSTAEEIGDEPLQYHKKFNGNPLVVVCERRIEGAEKIHLLHPEINLLLLDDAYQHRAIIRNVNLLLSDFNRPFYEDQPFPAGRMRETRRGARRSDAVIVTKCPTNLSENDKAIIIKRTQKYTLPRTPVFFAGIQYAGPRCFDETPVRLKKVKLVAGIANPQTFIAHIRHHFDVTEEIIFPDHHNYSNEDLERLIKYLKNDTFVITTEKDMVKLKPLADQSGALASFAYVPITVNFGNDTGRFNKWITQQIP